MVTKDSSYSDYREKIIRVENEVKKAIIGIDRTVELVVSAIFSRGHVLLDGLPGVAKTTLCLAVARALNGEMVKFEGRPDFMPSQFLYITEPDENGNPKFYKGPILTKSKNLAITLLDEITRFLPQAQAFFFEIMNEYRITLPSGEIPLSHNRVLATKNKVTRGETNDIPQPQLDRFLLNVELTYPEPSAEMRIITDEAYDNPAKLVLLADPVLELDELEEIVDGIQSSVRMSRDMAKYFFDVVNATRYPSKYGVKIDGIADVDSLVDNRHNSSGVSPRGAAKWRRIAKVMAIRRGDDTLIPEDALNAAKEVLAHRIFINLRAAGDRNRSTLAGDFLTAVLEKVGVP